MSEIARCDYCGRGMYLSEGDTCKGCGSPFPPKAPRYDGPTLQFLYDASKIERPILGRPGTLIPISNFGDLEPYFRAQVEQIAQMIIPIR